MRAPGSKLQPYSDLASIKDSVWSGVSDSLWEAGLGDHWDLSQFALQNNRGWLSGSHDAAWLGGFSFFRDQCGLVVETSKLTGLIATALECGWWTPCDDICFVSSKPTRIDLARKIVTYDDGLECS